MVSCQAESLLMALDLDDASPLIQHLASLPDEVLLGFAAVGSVCGLMLLTALVVMACRRIGSITQAIALGRRPVAWPGTR